MSNDLDQLIKALSKLVEEVPEQKHELNTINKIEQNQISLDELYPTRNDGFMLNYVDKNGAIKQKCDYDGLSNYLINEYGLKCDDSLIYIWTGKHYRPTSFLKLKNLINKIVKANSTPSSVNNYFNKSLIASYVDFNEMASCDGYINCNNGLLNLDTKELQPHNERYLIKYVLSHDYKPNASCPVFYSALDLVTNNDDELKELIAQVFGYCIMGGYPKAHKAFMFYGGGGNGKSTILTALRNLVGIENASHVPLTHLDKPFSMISLDGKLVNLIDETPKFNINAEAFKNVVSGGFVRAAHKNKPEFDLQVQARFIFACNKLPNFKDDSEGLERRLVIIPFNNKIDESKMDRDIDVKIKNEISGVLNFAIKGYESLVKSGFSFIKPKASVDAFEQYKRETNSVHYFFSEALDFLNGPTGDEEFILNHDLFRIYSQFCSINKLFGVSENRFKNMAHAEHNRLFEENLIPRKNNDIQRYSLGRGFSRLKINGYLKDLLKNSG